MQSQDKGITYHINHRFKDEIIVPLVAITNNVAFLFDTSERSVVMGDGVIGKVISCDEVHICALESEINRMYNITPWAFVARWYKIYPQMDSMFFLKLKLSNEV
jgi:hypothetical protein